MTKPKQPKAARIAELERKLQEALAGQAHRYKFAQEGLKKAGEKHLAGSGIVLTMTVLGGRELFEPVVIRDGLTEATIEALNAEMVRSYELATLYKPTTKEPAK